MWVDPLGAVTTQNRREQVRELLRKEFAARLLMWFLHGHGIGKQAAIFTSEGAGRVLLYLHPGAAFEAFWSP
jgi:hypothetical protein